MFVDEAYQRLAAIRAELERAIGKSHSEQDVRLQLINRMLVEVLNWPLPLIRTEKPTSSGFIDYAVVDQAGQNICVIEAKKIGALHLDTAATKLTTVSVGGQVLKPATDGISQAIRYAAETGTVYAVLTDGARWIFFRAIRSDGIPPREGKAFVFPSLTAVLEDFGTFYELLSPLALSEQLHIARLNTLEGGHIRAAEPRYYIRNPDEARLLPRTDLGRDIVELFKRFFAAMASDQDDDMRRVCFVETPESKEADTSLTKIATHLTNSIKSLETEHGKELEAAIEATVASKMSELCLIVGGSGAGKSTFITRFFQDVMSPRLRGDCVAATIDVSEYPGGSANIQEWLAKQLRDKYERALFNTDTPDYDDYMGMYFSTYQRWSNAVYKNLYETNKNEFKIKFGEHVEQSREERPYEYAVGMLQHTVKARERLPCVVFDNIDRFPAAIQAEVVQFAAALKTSCPSFILLTAADRAVWQLSKTANIQSYFSRSFYLPTPAAKEVLARRVGYIRAKLEDDERTSGAYFSSRGLKISIKDLGAFATVIEETLVNHE